MPSTNGLSGRVALSACFAVLLVLVSGASAVAAEGEVPGCTPAIGRVVSRQGSVEIRRAGTSEWHRVERLDTQVCDGDAVRTGPRSRAALWLQPENLIRLDQRTAVTMFSNQAETRVEFFQPIAGGPVLADPDCGAAYFISRFPRDFGVRTPFLSAAIKGTEFLVAAQCSSTTLAVFEGIVAAKELQTGREFRIERLQQISVGPALPSSIPIPIKPRDGVQWTIYYPRTAGRRTDERQMAVEPCRPGLAGSDCEIARIEAMLDSGSAGEAEAAIGRLKAEGIGGADVAALDAIVRIARNELEQGLAIATKATEAEHENERAWTALSYARQALYDIDGALAAAERAADSAPTSSLAKAREAEMLLTVGRLKEAEAAARTAHELDPNEPRVLQILGFVQLARLDGRAAMRSLEAALELDPADPRTRLGLGLAKIRQRRLVDGREDLEIAVALDPTSALTRTYLGRAYFEEKRRERDLMAREQYGLASQLDPADPTPWFYEGVRKQSDNRPIEAISDVRRSIRLNDQRSVYRPRSALDQDAAARGAALARLFAQIGFEESARVEAASALSEDPTSFAAQQYLSDIAAVSDRQQSTRASAGLQAQLRAPLGADVPLVGLTSSNSLAPGRPYLSVDTIGPPRPGLYDFDPLFSGPGIKARVRGLTGSFGTASHDLSASATFDRSSFALGMFHAETNGQRVNNDQLRNAYAGLVTVKPTAAVTLQVDMQQSEASFGDLPIRWDPAFVAVNDRNTEQFSTGRVGMRGELTPVSEVLFTLTQAESKAELVDRSFPYSIGINGSFTGAEAQYAHNLRPLRLVAGLSYIEGTRRVAFDFPGFGTSSSKAGNREQTAYVYATLAPFGEKLKFIAGATWDDSKLNSILVDQERTHPKLGMLWQPTDATAIRLASFGVTQRLLPGNQTLEPVQVVGFWQMYDDPFGTASRQTSAAIDHRLGESVYIGGGAALRRLEVPYTAFDPFGQPIGALTKWNERQGFGYVRLLPTDRFALSVQVLREQFERTAENQGTGAFLTLKQWVAPATVQWFGPHGIGASVRVTYLGQEGVFCAAGASICDLPGSERSVLTDLGLSYRLPRRAGSVSLDVLNAFDQQFRYQSVDTSRLVPFTGRAVFARVTLVF